MNLRGLTLLLTVAGCATTHVSRPTPVAHNLPIDRVDALLSRAPIEVLEARRVGRGAAHSMLLTARLGPHGPTVRLKWKMAARGGEGVNRSPRHELAAYALQQMLLEQEDYVVPPTAGRCLTRAELRSISDDEPAATFDGADCVFGTLSYWLDGVEEVRGLDEERFERDPAYRRAIANLNLVTYLIDHRDCKRSNFLITQAPLAPHAFTVDNGLAFSGFRTIFGWFGTNWSHLLVPSLPTDAVTRLRRIDEAALRDRLAVVAQYEVRDDGRLVPVEPTAPFDEDLGVRRRGDVVQLGLTRAEIAAVDRRLHRVLAAVDKGEVAQFAPSPRRTAAR